MREMGRVKGCVGLVTVWRSVGAVEEVVLEKIAEVDRVEMKVLIGDEAHTLAGAGQWRACG